MGQLIRTDEPRERLAAPPLRRGYLVRGPVAPVFVEAGALAPEDAIAFSPDKGQARAFATLRDAGVVRAAGGGWWLDIVAYQARAAARTRAMVPFAILLSVAAAITACLFYVADAGPLG